MHLELPDGVDHDLSNYAHDNGEHIKMRIKMPTIECSIDRLRNQTSDDDASPVPQLIVISQDKVHDIDDDDSEKR